jgi:hypothetical protein
MLTASAMFIPPSAIIPLIVLWMCITNKIESGGWYPGTPFWIMIRILAVAYLFTFLAHTIYGSIVFAVARAVRARSYPFWIGLYLVFPLLLAFYFATTTTELEDAFVHVFFAFAIGSLAWPFIRPALVFPKA